MTIKQLIKELEDWDEEDMELEVEFFINAEIGGSVMLKDGRRCIGVIVEEN